VSWTHNICRACWEKRNPGREPVRVLEPPTIEVACCFCGEPTPASIYVRHDGRELHCKGTHPQ
jgi:hypothetical protein